MYVQGDVQRLSTLTDGAVKIVEVIRWKVNKVEVNIKNCHVTCHVTSILKILIRAGSM